MGQLHEILAVEKSTDDAASKLVKDTLMKFGKAAAYFEGSDKTLKMLTENPANEALEASLREEKGLVTTVYETLSYTLDFVGRAEDVKFQKSLTNQKATGDIVVNGKILVANVPVDMLLGLEARLTTLRNVFDQMPTQNAATEWVPADSSLKGAVKTKTPTVTTKTEKRVSGVTVSPATDKHPAQVQIVNTDEIVGKFTTVKFSGAATSEQKAAMLENIDALIRAVKQARQRANSIEAVKETISDKLIPFLMAPLNQ